MRETRRLVPSEERSHEVGGEIRGRQSDGGKHASTAGQRLQQSAGADHLALSAAAAAVVAAAVARAAPASGVAATSLYIITFGATTTTAAAATDGRTA